VEGVVPAAAVDVVNPVVAPEHLVRVHNAIGVVIGDPEFGSGQHDRVIALATDYRIETATAFEVVVADATIDRVVAGAADQRILAAAAVQRVVSPLSIEVFDSAPAADRVVVLRAGDPFYAHDRCGTAEARPGPRRKVDRDGSDIA